MKVTIKWKYPDEAEDKLHVRLYYGVTAFRVAEGALFVKDENGWHQYALGFIVSAETSEDD